MKRKGKSKPVLLPRTDKELKLAMLAFITHYFDSAGAGRTAVIAAYEALYGDVLTPGIIARTHRNNGGNKEKFVKKHLLSMTTLFFAERPVCPFPAEKVKKALEAGMKAAGSVPKVDPLKPKRGRMKRERPSAPATAKPVAEPAQTLAPPLSRAIPKPASSPKAKGLRAEDGPVIAEALRRAPRDKGIYDAAAELVAGNVSKSVVTGIEIERFVKTPAGGIERFLVAYGCPDREAIDIGKGVRLSQHGSHKPRDGE